MELTKEGVRKAFTYENGHLYYKIVLNGHRPGDRAGFLSTTGYMYVYLNENYYRIERLIWLYHYGYLAKLLCRIDRNRGTHCIENLREATALENSAISRKMKSLSSRFKGVLYNKNPRLKKHWIAYAGFDGVIKHFGSFDTEEEAARGYDRAAIESQGDLVYTNEDAGLYY